MKMKLYKKLNKQKTLENGFGLIEVLIASAIISASLIALASVVQLSFRVSSESFKTIKAEFLAEEGLEVMLILRNDSWLSLISSLSTTTPYYLIFSTTTSSWQATSTNPGLTLGRYTRTIIIGEVYRRNSDDDIVASTSPDAKTLDTGTIKVTSRVSWEGAKSVEFVTYIADIFSN